MSILRTNKLIVSDPFSGRLIRMNADPLGDEWEEWGHFVGGSDVARIVGGINLATWDKYCDAYYDEDAMVLYLASDSKGVLKLDLVNDTATVYDVAGGSLRNDVCYGLLVNVARSQMVVLHGANGISIIDPATGTQASNFACAGATCQRGTFNQAETEIVVWASATDASLPARITLATGVVTAWAWGAMPNAGTKYTDDCDFSDDDATLYVVLHFSSTPAGATSRQVLITVDPTTMTPTSWDWSTATGVATVLYANTGVVDASVGYYAHAFGVVSKAAIYRLSTKALITTYDTTTSPVFGNKDAGFAKSYSLRKGKRGGLFLAHSHAYQFDNALRNFLTIYAIDPVTLLWSLKYNVLNRPDQEAVEPHLEEGVDLPPVYASRSIPDDREGNLQQFHEYDDHFLVSNATPSAAWSACPRLFHKDLPWSVPYGLYRREDNGVLYVLDRKDTPTSNLNSRIVRFNGWNEGGRLALGYSTEKDGEGSYTTGQHVGCIESENLVFHSSRRPADYGVLFSDFAYDVATDVEFVMTPSFDCAKVIGEFIYEFVYDGVQGHVVGMKRDSSGAVVQTQEYDELGPTSYVYDLWIDPDDGRHYLACADRVARYDSFAGDGYAGFGTSGGGVNQFSSPRGIVGDVDYLYIADTGNNRVVRIDKAAFDGTGWAAFGTRGFAGEGTFSYPCKLATMVVETGIPEPTGLYLPPDMVDSINLTHEFATTTFKTFAETERRAGHVGLPIRTLTFQLSTMESSFMAVLFRKLQELRAEEWFYVPVWPYAMTLSSSIVKNDTSIAVLDASSRELPATGVLLIFSTIDKSEAAEFISRIGNEFVLSNGMSQGFDTEDTLVIPCMTVFLNEQQELSRFERFKMMAMMSFEELITGVS